MSIIPLPCTKFLPSPQISSPSNPTPKPKPYIHSTSIAAAMQWSSGRVLAPAPPHSDWWDKMLFSGAVVVKAPYPNPTNPNLTNPRSAESPKSPNPASAGNPKSPNPNPTNPKSPESAAYRMYYYGRSSENWNMGVKPFNKTLPTGRIGMALSADGTSFQRHRGDLLNGAIFDPSDDPSAFDSVHVAVSDAVYSENKWHLYYFGGGMLELPLVGKPDEKHRGLRLLPGIASSSDGFQFGDRRGPLLDVGKPGSWDENGVSWPRLFTGDGDKLFMTYHTRESGGFFSAGLAVSGEGGKWEKVGKILSAGEAGAWDEGGVSVRHVIRVGDEYVMFYEGSNFRFEFAIGLALSNDGVTWQKDVACGREPGGPVLTARTGEDVWDNVIVGTPYVLEMLDGGFRMYYLGVGKVEVDGEAMTQQGIGLAVSDGANFRSWKRYGC